MHRLDLSGVIQRAFRLLGVFFFLLSLMEDYLVWIGRLFCNEERVYHHDFKRRNPYRKRIGSKAFFGQLNREHPGSVGGIHSR